jgi:hypothetical protein
MKKITALSLAILLLVLSTATASDLSWYGKVRNYTGVLSSQDFEYAMMQNTFDLSLEYYGENSAFLVNPYFNYDLDKELTINLREAYIDLYLEDADLRIGQQQIIWGKANGAFITDVVSPKNLQEFLLPDFIEIRLGVTALNLNYYKNDSTYQLIWVPIFTPNTLPEKTSIWNLNDIDFSQSADDIDISLKNSEIFARYSLYTPKIDFELMGGYMFDDEPTPIGGGEFTHYRTSIIGGSLSSTLGDVIIRSEGALYNGKHVNASIEMDYLHYMVGLDYKINGWNFSAQFIQKVYLDYKDDNPDINKWQNTLTFMTNKEFLENTLRLELFTYLEFNDLNALIRPKVTYDLSDDINLIFGSNIFLGDSGTFGQFDDNDTIYAKIELSF